MSYIPAKEADLLTWGNNFQTKIAAAPATYGLQAADATAITTDYNAFSTAYATANNPSTRNAVSVAAKDGAKAAFLTLARMYAAIIRANAGVADGDKIALGLTVKDDQPSPVPDPSTPPLVSVPLMGVGQHQIHFRDMLMPDKKAHPEGCRGVMLVRTITAAPSADMEAAVPVAILNKADEVLDTSTLDKGKYANYAARWYGTRGTLGPISSVVSALIV